LNPTAVKYPRFGDIHPVTIAKRTRYGVSHEGECPRLLPFIIGNSACTSRVGGKPEQAGRVTCLECRWLAPLRVIGAPGRAGPGRSHEYARDMHGERERRSGLCCCGRGDGVSRRRWREAWPASSCAVTHRRGASLRCPAFHRFTAMSATSKKPRTKRRRSPTGHR
jgi:hypothetical protein